MKNIKNEHIVKLIKQLEQAGILQDDTAIISISVVSNESDDGTTDDTTDDTSTNECCNTCNKKCESCNDSQSNIYEVVDNLKYLYNTDTDMLDILRVIVACGSDMLDDETKDDETVSEKPDCKVEDSTSEKEVAVAPNNSTNIAHSNVYGCFINTVLTVTTYLEALSFMFNSSKLDKTLEQNIQIVASEIDNTIEKLFKKYRSSGNFKLIELSELINDINRCSIQHSNEAITTTVNQLCEIHKQVRYLNYILNNEAMLLSRLNITDAVCSLLHKGVQLQIQFYDHKITNVSSFEQRCKVLTEIQGMVEYVLGLIGNKTCESTLVFLAIQNLVKSYINNSQTVVPPFKIKGANAKDCTDLNLQDVKRARKIVKNLIDNT